MRGIAALFVLTRHTHAYWPFEFYRSYLAVDLFFILSGFVIAHAYDQKLASRRISTGDFAASRLIRLYPMFFLSVVIASLALISQIIFFGVHPTETAGNIGLMILFTAFFLPSHFFGADYHLFPLNLPYWSLFFELVANAIYVAIHRYLSLAVLSMIIVASFAYTARSAIKNGNLNTGFMWGLGMFATGTLRTTLGFFFGVLLYRCREAFSRHIIRYLSPWFGILIIVGVLYSRSLGALDPYADLLAVCVLFPIAVLIASNSRRTGWERILLMLGSASYPVYVLHLPMGVLVRQIFGSRVEHYAPWSGYVFAAFLVALSIQLEKYYDIPVRRWLSAKLARRKAHRAEALGAAALRGARDGAQNRVVPE
jgi:peptidoglycan/LPS O-acetylase OafA/YrhL